MREHYNNLSKIQEQDNKSKSKSKTKIEYNYSVKFFYNSYLMSSCESGVLKKNVFIYILNI